MIPSPELRRKVLKHPFFKLALCWLLSFYIRLARLTGRWTYIIPEASKPLMDGKEQCICAFWHGRMLLMPTFKPKGHAMHVLISSHRDGVMIARVIRFFRIDTVVGSSSKGSLAALRQIKTLLKNGDNLSVTPDGPRGPNRTAAQGIVYTAQISGMPVLPVTYSAVRAKQFKSWDKFMIPMLFTRMVFVAGEPITVPRELDEAAMEHYRLAVETEMNRITDHADTLAGRPLWQKAS